MLSPRQIVLKNTVLAEDQRSLVVGQTFDTVSKLSLLQLLDETPDTTDPVVAAAAYHRLMGARSYLRMLVTIAEPVTQPPVSVTGNLNHKV